MGEITELLHAARAGDPLALDEVFARVYPTLRALADSRLRTAAGDDTLSPTALVHETYLKLIGASRLDMADQHHFFACAARAMRQILVDHARSRHSLRRGGDAARVTLDQAEMAEQAKATEVDLLDLDSAMNNLDEIQPELRELVELRVFGGLTLQQLADTTGRSLRSTNRDWQRARALLLAQIA